MKNLQFILSRIMFLIFMFLVLIPKSATIFAAERQDFKVTEVVLRTDNTIAKEKCPREIKFRGSITTNGAGTVKYFFVRSDGASSPTYQLKFEKAGTLEIETSWMLGVSYKGYQIVKVIAPNEVESNRETGFFIFTCGSEEPPPSASEKVEIFCPVRQIRAEVTTGLPDLWWQTPQVGSLQSVSIENIGGVQTLVCQYRAYDTTVGIMRRFPDGKSNCEASLDRFVCW